MSILFQLPLLAQVGVGVEAPKDADQLFNGKKRSLNKNWTYWEGPRIAAQLPIKWEIVPDPVDKGEAVSSNAH